MRPFWKCEGGGSTRQSRKSVGGECVAFSTIVHDSIATYDRAAYVPLDLPKLIPLPRSDDRGGWLCFIGQRVQVEGRNLSHRWWEEALCHIYMWNIQNINVTTSGEVGKYCCQLDYGFTFCDKSACRLRHWTSSEGNTHSHWSILTLNSVRTQLQHIIPERYGWGRWQNPNNRLGEWST